MLTWGSGIAAWKEFSPHLLGFNLRCLKCPASCLTFHSEQFHGLHTQTQIQTRNSSWMWCYAVGQMCNSILRDCSAFIFKVKEFMVWPWMYRHYDPMKCNRLLAWWHSITPLKTCMCSTTIVSPHDFRSNLQTGTAAMSDQTEPTALVGVAVTIIHMQ